MNQKRKEGWKSREGEPPDKRVLPFTQWHLLWIEDSGPTQDPEPQPPRLCVTKGSQDAPLWSKHTDRLLCSSFYGLSNHLLGLSQRQPDPVRGFPPAPLPFPQAKHSSLRQETVTNSWRWVRQSPETGPPHPQVQNIFWWWKMASMSTPEQLAEMK